LNKCNYEHDTLNRDEYPRCLPK